MDAVTYDKVLDARGLSCPLPIVKARQELTTLQPGQVLKVLATDRGSAGTHGSAACPPLKTKGRRCSPATALPDVSAFRDRSAP